jgi:acyl-coenzyme A synthetase/AMP-(fatty) acid ligase/3-hydroxymyristoyl/3-hydroxydecanoyl-(acyl carrier protein) dehydratase
MDAQVIFSAGEAIGYERFRNDILAARQALSHLGSPKIVLFEPDVHAFAVWLLAAWSLGITVVLPGDDLAATREALALPWVGLDGNGADDTLRSWRDEASAREGGADTPRDFGVPGLILFTSGSSGKPVLVEKTLTQLRREIEALEKRFGAYLVPGKTRFVSSVPHQHMYGLPFFVLWPLSFAYPIVADKIAHPEDHWRLPAADYVLVSAPTFLKYLASAAEDSFPVSSGICWKLAVSAGSALSAGLQARCQALLKAPLFEIYGSTETGAVACRQGGAWQAMPGVRLSVDGNTSRLRIQSPFLAPEMGKEGFLSSDLARMGAQGLELIGRADRIFKIGEKRISLTQLEEALAALADVERVAVLPLRGERKALGAVVVLTDAGKARKARLGKARFDRDLRNALRERFEAIALPRRWRHVDAFPVNAMGKTTQGELERLFAPLLPRAECLSQARGDADGEVSLQLRIDPDLAWFNGHFPGLPILPGVVQIDWAAHFGRLHFGLDAPITQVSGLKFCHLIRPGDAPRLHLVWRAGKRELTFSYLLETRHCSRGVLVFRNPEAKAGKSGS